MTKGIVVYLSYTGNTKQIAEATYRGMSKLMDQSDIVRLRETHPKDLIGYDLIGIGSPVRLGKMPSRTQGVYRRHELIGRNALLRLQYPCGPAG